MPFLIKNPPDAPHFARLTRRLFGKMEASGRPLFELMAILESGSGPLFKRRMGGVSPAIPHLPKKHAIFESLGPALSKTELGYASPRFLAEGQSQSGAPMRRPPDMRRNRHDHRTMPLIIRLPPQPDPEGEACCAPIPTLHAVALPDPTTNRVVPAVVESGGSPCGWLAAPTHLTV